MDDKPNYKFLDLSYLFEIIEDDEEALKSILDEFLETTPADISSLTDAIANQNYTAIIELSHKLKATFNFLGVSSAKPLIAIEAGAKENMPIENIKELYILVLEGYNGAVTELSSKL
jgi:HPt (histidine-containing phosphotransfer) domain-containing protein